MTGIFQEMTPIVQKVRDVATASDAAEQLAPLVARLEQTSREYQQARRTMQPTDSETEEYVEHADAFFAEFYRIKKDPAASEALQRTFARIDGFREDLAE